ncbi:thioredoxin domain-containing protein [Dermacoccus barathri]|uniref:thioredoxin domain-containing protein n=1 Tax=Dermacoccus barathri TaxID=322601 RepID=UPI00187A91DF|nr:thioredoxin domain-containing protein [Dermacoccus barathri]MBE7370366.1 thioredoxin domain-containing protein [Dermacoccus barathri]
MANRLAASLSPYLRQHADNPVDWREWDDAAFAEARERDVPILLSVGYAACHWCHVMAHESFEDPEVAAVVNANFVAVKVDREERPDIDAVYMNVTQALTGHGGWPMTVFLTPDAAPLYAGTYFPRDHFLQVLSAIDDVWRTDRERAESSGRAIVDAVSGMTVKTSTSAIEFDDEALAASITALRREFDDARGGFGGAPKFPPSMTLEHLLRHHARTGDADALAMAERTCEAMARGGMYDQLDGGFARYSVDAAWVVPHFEKMLYDNAQLLRVYAHLWRATGSALARRVTVETAEFMLRRLLTDEGAFASALDADTDGVEGLTYAWTPAQLVEVLGDEDGARAARLLEVTPHGTFEHGSSTLQLRQDPGDVFAPDEVGDPDAWWHDVRSRLLAARDRRPQPARDDKVVTSWNGLALAALAEAAMILDEPRWLDAARTAADVVLEAHVVDGRLRRTSLGGGVSEALGCADDYGNLAEGLLVLHQATGEACYLRHATELFDASRDLFVTDGVVYDTGSDAEQLFTRPRSTGDNAEPCGASALANAAVMAFALTGEAAYREFAEVCLGQLGAVARQAPRFAGWALAAAEALAAGPVQVAIVSDGNSPDTDAMATGAWQATSPGLVRVVGRTDAEGVPLLADRPATGGRATAYVCRGFVCDAPTTDVGELERSLREV